MRSRSIITAGLAVVLVLGAIMAYAQTGTPQSKSSLNSEINTLFANNTTGQITPTALRQVTLDMVASMQVPSGISVAVRSSSANVVTAIAATDYFLCLDPTSNTITVNLPSSPALGLSFLIKDCTGQSAAHIITVVPASGNIDGQANLVIGVPFQSAAVTYTGAQWSIN